jgi:AcrR family transcriptional regulator
MAIVESDDAADVAPAEQDERTRGRLLRAAVSVFDRKGYAAASVREIVELAGVTKPALYYHFGSKERLLAAVLDEAARAFARKMEQAMARSGTARDRLFALCTDINELFQEHVPVVRVAHAAFFGPIEGSPPFDFTSFDREMERAVRQIVEDGQASGEIASTASPSDVALMMMGIIGVFAMRQLHYGINQIDLGTLQRMVGLLFDGALGQQRQQGEPRS